MDLKISVFVLREEEEESEWSGKYDKDDNLVGLGTLRYTITQWTLDRYNDKDMTIWLV